MPRGKSKLLLDWTPLASARGRTNMAVTMSDRVMGIAVTLPDGTPNFHEGILLDRAEFNELIQLARRHGWLR